MYASKVIPDHMRKDPVLWGTTASLNEKKCYLELKKMQPIFFCSWSDSLVVFFIGEGMGGSLYWRDLISLARAVGFSTPGLVSSTAIVVHDDELKAKAGTATGFLKRLRGAFSHRLLNFQVTSDMPRALTECSSCPKPLPGGERLPPTRELCQSSQISWTLTPSTLSRCNKRLTRRYISHLVMCSILVLH